MKIAIAGGVSSSRRTLKKLLEHQIDVVGVLGYERGDASQVSGYARMDGLCREAGVPYRPFVKINSPECEAALRAWKPDVLMAVGLSQLVGQVILSIPRLGTIGFHPTRLPVGRGRAPIAWLILDQQGGAATFFLVGEGMDDGPVFVQENFDVSGEDDAGSVEAKILAAIDVALDRWLPDLKRGLWSPMRQDEKRATYYGRRLPEDGLIDWQQPAGLIDRLVKASTRPHPGAYTYWQGRKMLVWSTSLVDVPQIKGVPGRVLLREDAGRLLVQAGDAPIWIKELELDSAAVSGATLPKVGERLGYQVEHQLHDIQIELSAIKKHLGL